MRDPLGRAAAGARQARRRLDPRLGDLRARHHRRRVRARCRAGRDRDDRRRMACAAISPSTRAAAALLHLRIYLFRAARLRRRRPQRLRGAQAHRRRAGAREPRAGRHGHSGADSGVPAALGYAAESGIPFELGIIRNHYVGRTFIEPSDRIRHLGVQLKHNANRADPRGQARHPGRRFHRARHDLEEDRGDGARRRRARGAFPHLEPADHAFLLLWRRHAQRATICWPHSFDVEEMRSFIGADSLAFISIDGLYRAMGETGRDRAGAAILRCLLLRRLPDPARRSRRRQGHDAALAAGRDGVKPAHGATFTGRFRLGLKERGTSQARRHRAKRGCANASGRRATVAKPRLCQRRTARSFVLTTRLNCMARKPRARARSSECSHMRRATPRPVRVGRGHIATIRHVCAAAELGCHVDNRCRRAGRPPPRQRSRDRGPSSRRARPPRSCRAARRRCRRRGSSARVCATATRDLAARRIGSARPDALSRPLELC